MTIKHPKAFFRESPANYDGVFNWDFLNFVFPRRITPTDIDGNVEINGHFLRFETKSPHIDTNLRDQAGQRLSIYRDVIMSSGRVIYLMIGKNEKTLSGFRVVSFWKNNLMIGNAKKYQSDDIIKFCQTWSAFADRNPAWGGGQFNSLFEMEKNSQKKNLYYRIPDCLNWKVIESSGDKLKTKKGIEIAKMDFDF